MEAQTLGKILPMRDIFPSKTNPRKRFNEAELKDLASSIKEHGVMQPILVRPIPGDLAPAYEIVAGERRWRATSMANIDTIPAVIRELSDLETLQLQIIENLQRSDLHPLEEAQGFKALLDNKDAASWNADQLAAKVGKSRSYIYGALKLNELCVYAQDMFLDNKFGRETALLIARIPGEKLQTLACKEIIKGNGLDPFSFRAAKSYIHQRYTLSLTEAKFDTNCKKLLPDAGACFSCPKRSGNYPELFSDIESADVCTDPDCFAAKKAAHIEIVISQHKRVLQGDEAKKVMPYGVDSYIDDRSFSKLASYDKDSRFDKPYSELLGDDLPEPIILIDDNKNMINLYEKTALAEKLEAKIASGELVVPEAKPRVKEDWEIKRDIRNKLAIDEESRRSDIVRNMADALIVDQDLSLLHFVLIEITKNIEFEAHVVLAYYGFEGHWDDFVQTIVLTNSKFMSTHELLKLLSLIYLSQFASIHWNWESAEDNYEDDNYKSIMEFAAQVGFDFNNFSNPELASTPPIAAQAEELTAEKNPDPVAEVAAPAERMMPPKLQAIKDAELAKRAKKAQKQVQKVSAKADALEVPADEAAGTETEVANA